MAIRGNLHLLSLEVNEVCEWVETRRYERRSYTACPSPPYGFRITNNCSVIWWRWNVSWFFTGRDLLAKSEQQASAAHQWNNETSKLYVLLLLYTRVTFTCDKLNGQLCQYFTCPPWPAALLRFHCDQSIIKRAPFHQGYITDALPSLSIPPSVSLKLFVSV